MFLAASPAAALRFEERASFRLFTLQEDIFDSELLKKIQALFETALSAPIKTSPHYVEAASHLISNQQTDLLNLLEAHYQSYQLQYEYTKKSAASSETVIPAIIVSRPGREIKRVQFFTGEEENVSVTKIEELAHTLCLPKLPQLLLEAPLTILQKNRLLTLCQRAILASHQKDPPGFYTVIKIIGFQCFFRQKLSIKQKVSSHAVSLVFETLVRGLTSYYYSKIDPSTLNLIEHLSKLSLKELETNCPPPLKDFKEGMLLLPPETRISICEICQKILGGKNLKDSYRNIKNCVSIQEKSNPQIASFSYALITAAKSTFQQIYETNIRKESVICSSDQKQFFLSKLKITGGCLITPTVGKEYLLEGFFFEAKPQSENTLPIALKLILAPTSMGIEIRMADDDQLLMYAGSLSSFFKGHMAQFPFLPSLAESALLRVNRTHKSTN